MVGMILTRVNEVTQLVLTAHGPIKQPREPTTVSSWDRFSFGQPSWSVLVTHLVPNTTQCDTFIGKHTRAVHVSLAPNA